MRTRLLLFLASWMLLGCPAAEDEASNDAATPAAADLSAFERRRAASSGAALEQQVADDRSAGARKVYASTEDEPTLIDLENAGETPPALGEQGDVSTAGSSSPTDLDRASEEVGPWINMDLVGQTIRSQHRSLKACFDQEAPSGGERRVDMRMTVDDRGRCGDAKIATSSPVKGRALDRCLSGVLEKAKFPEARDGDKTFSYVLRF